MNIIDLKCAKPNHQSSRIVFICLDSKCKNNRRCCIKCAESHHAKHDLVSIDKFINEVNHNMQKYNNHPQKIQINQFIDNLAIEFSQQFNELRTRVLKEISMVQSKVSDFLKTVQQLFVTEPQTTIKSHILNSIAQTQSVLEDYWSVAHRASKIEIGAFKEVKSKLTQYFSSIQDAKWTVLVQITKSTQTLQKTCMINCLAPKIKEKDFAFSNINKALCIQLEDSKKTISTQSANQSYTICCLEKPLDFTNNWFCVRIDKSPNKKIWMGVCDLNIVKKNNFVNCFGTGKGTYAIDQSGGVNSFTNTSVAWLSSHHELQHPASGISPYSLKWNFKEGDLLFIRVDRTGNFIQFFVLNQEYDPEGNHPTNQIYLQYHYFEMQLLKKDLYPFVGFSQICGDMATILSKNQLDKVTAIYGNKWLEFIGQGQQNAENDDDDAQW